VLEGSVRRDGQRLRISTKLVSVADGRPLWSESFDRDLSDVFAVQGEIARSVVGALKVRLLGAGAATLAGTPRASSEAYLQYLLGRQLYVRGSEEDIRRSVRAYRSAVAMDPRFAAGWAELALALVMVADQAESLDAIRALHDQAMEAADQAMKLDPRLARSHGARGLLRGILRHEWGEGIADLQRAVALQPGDPFNLRALAWLLLAVGRTPESRVAARAAVDLDPLGARSWMVLAAIQQASGDAADARGSFDRALGIAPDHGSAAASIAKLEILAGRPREALALARAHRGSPGYRLQVMALAEHDLGNAQESRRMGDEMVTAYGHTMAFQIAEVHAYRGELDDGFHWLDRAAAQSDQGLTGTKHSLFLKAARGDPRYVGFLRRINLPVD
jgi:tetratricopeptide (TPR) repeat protein